MLKCVCLSLFFICLTKVTIGQNTIGGTTVTPRMRVIMDNDFSGDPDGLFALAHLLLSPSVEVRGIIGSHLKVGDGFDNSTTQADNAVKKANELMQVMNVQKTIPVIAGSNIAMRNDSTPVQSEAVNFIIKEAMRTDTELPLYVLCGAGLTEIASAILTNPAIAGKMTLVWIGGPEYAHIAPPPPNYSNPEYNLNIDIAAARVIFNQSNIPVWQVPRSSYRQAILPYSQLLQQIQPRGKTGRFLTDVLEKLMVRLRQYVNIGETYILGDSPLVLLTALQTSFEADPASSEYVVVIAPLIDEKGAYQFNHHGRNIRVYTKLDIPLMFNDFFAKLALMNP